MQKVILKDFSIFTGKQLWWSLFFKKVSDLEAFNFILKKSVTQVSSCEFCKIFTNTFFTEHIWWLLPSPKQIKRNKKLL